MEETRSLQRELSYAREKADSIETDGKYIAGLMLR